MIDQSLQYLKGVGPQRYKQLSRLNIFTVRDLLGYFPRQYEDRRRVTKSAFLQNDEKAVMIGKVEVSEVLSLSPRLSVFRSVLRDSTGIFYASFYRNINPYHKHDIFAALKQSFSPAACIILYGRCTISFGKNDIQVEDFEILENPEKPFISNNFNCIVPLYSLTEGLTQKWMRNFIKLNIEMFSKEWPELMCSGHVFRKKYISAPSAIYKIHFPEDFSVAEKARQSLAFDEFLLLETALNIARHGTMVINKPRSYTIKRSILTPFRKKLNFEFTKSQKKVINEIFSDLNNSSPMNRLLLGDVGSGKTIVALSAMLLVVENGYQAALLAPTEILAEQHFLTLNNLLSGLTVKIALMTGRISRNKKDKQNIIVNIASGKVDIVVGTHALLEENIKFKNLALLIIDEQHRFGVLQRAALQKKSYRPDVLLMTATPIPRSLALTLYGDMDISKITDLPPGRKPIQTLHLNENMAYEMVKKEIKGGHQAYIVYPLIEESDKIELKAAVQEASNLSNSVFNGFRVGLLHGQMKSQEKQQIMKDFRENKFDILFATTVIEVGIDVPNASIMLIEHSDRFGLATLHQLRGRVGRGTVNSFCVLLGNPKSDDAKKRLSVMLATNDGFRIADEDLALRGPGEFFGTAQHGIPPFKAGNLITDESLIKDAREAAILIVKNDNKLIKQQNSFLKNEILRIYANRFGLLNIG